MWKTLRLAVFFCSAVAAAWACSGSKGDADALADCCTNAVDLPAAEGLAETAGVDGRGPDAAQDDSAAGAEIPSDTPEAALPQAFIWCKEGQEVPPQTMLHLIGADSTSPNGEIAKWKWTVEQPVGSVSPIKPSPHDKNIELEANVAGVYTFHLQVWDSTGASSTDRGAYSVWVVPNETIHIELLWTTPEDPDESDEGPEAGSDVDLHLLHPLAAGPDLDGNGVPDGWYDIPWDCFFFNAQPNWANPDPLVDDDPGLDRDDTDGAGPENINLNTPEDVVYKVGVHYWNDHGYGPAYVTVRFYLEKDLKLEIADVLLLDSDMWEVGTVAWPSGKITVKKDEYGQYKITPHYQNPYFFQ